MDKESGQPPDCRARLRQAKSSIGAPDHSPATATASRSLANVPEVWQLEEGGHSCAYASFDVDHERHSGGTKSNDDNRGDAIASPQSVPTPGTSSTGTPSVADQLVQIAALRDAGTITDEEFEIIKSRLVNRTTSPAKTADVVHGPAMPPAPTAEPPAAWHRDPMGRHELRYWTGTSWSEHVADGGASFVDPL